ncbi:hypothetical protein THAOC_25129, partial [Thalassiosira oceanica]
MTVWSASVMPCLACLDTRSSSSRLSRSERLVSAGGRTGLDGARRVPPGRMGREAGVALGLDPGGREELPTLAPAGGHAAAVARRAPEEDAASAADLADASDAHNSLSTVPSLGKGRGHGRASYKLAKYTGASAGAGGRGLGRQDDAQRTQDKDGRGLLEAVLSVLDPVTRFSHLSPQSPSSPRPRGSRETSSAAGLEPARKPSTTNMSRCIPVAAAEACANCGKPKGDGIKLKNCTACRLVKYCGVDCQRAHRKLHKKACKQRVAELKDEQLC